MIPYIGVGVIAAVVGWGGFFLGERIGEAIADANWRQKADGDTSMCSGGKFFRVTHE